MDWVRRVWKDPVASKIIASIIIVGLGYFSGFLDIVGQQLVLFGKFLLEETLIYNWFLLLLCALSLGLIILLVAKVVNNLKKTITFKSYTSDKFEGLNWQWGYYGTKIEKLTPLCPKCLLEIVPNKVDDYLRESHHEFLCEECEYSLSVSGSEIYPLYQKVTRSIERIIRTGEWAKKIKT